MKFTIKDRISRMFKEPTWSEICIGGMILITITIFTISEIKGKRNKDDVKLSNHSTVSEVINIKEIEEVKAGLVNDRTKVAPNYRILKSGNKYVVKCVDLPRPFDIIYTTKEDAIYGSWLFYDNEKRKEYFNNIEWEIVE